MFSYKIRSFSEKLEFYCEETPEPTGAEVLVRIDACGVCHSDLHIWDGYFDLGGGKKITVTDRGVRLPFTMGHEIVGEVVACGELATDIQVGTRGVVYPWIGCGTCHACLSDQETCCPNPRTLGTRRNGGYGDHVIAPNPRYIVPFGDLDPHLAATCACSGLTAYSALKKVPPLTSSDTVMIIGAGGVGLACVGLASTLLPAKVIVADILASNRDAALALGASEALDPREPDSAKAVTTSAGRPPKAIIDFVGSPETIKFALESVAIGGTIVVVGLYGGELPISTALLPLRQISLRGSYVGTLPELRELLQLMGRVQMKVPITLRPMSEVNEILNDLKSGKVVGRCVMQPVPPELSSSISTAP